MLVNNYVYLAQNGDEEALEKIITDYQGLIYKISSSFFLKGGDFNDLSQEGYIGFLKAIRTFKDDKGASFSTFATLCIRRQIITAIKTANSDKYKILNLNNEIEDNTDFKMNSVLKTPEDILLGKELANLLKIYLAENLSLFEKKVFFYLCKQNTYIEIANILDESPKKIDNTIQRIKKKIKQYLELYY